MSHFMAMPLHCAQSAAHASTSECLTLVATLLVVGACASARPAGLDALKAEQRNDLYRTCIDGHMKSAGFGSGMAVHRACLDWASRQL